MKELKYTKNSKFEIIFENLDEVKNNRNYILYCKDLETIMYFPNIDKRYNLFIPYFPTTIFEELSCLMKKKSHNGCQIYTLDNENSKFENITNILPKWNILEDNAVLFLTEEDSVKYSANYSTYFTYPDCINAINIIEQNGIDDVDCIKYYKTISIIIPELHVEDKSCPYHIENINKVCKELKKKYGVERIELFVSHCFIKPYFIVKDAEWCILYQENYIDKIITTNSTEVFEVQNSDKLEVVDVVEFFNI